MNNFAYNFQDQVYTAEHPLGNFSDQLHMSLLMLSYNKSGKSYKKIFKQTQIDRKKLIHLNYRIRIHFDLIFHLLELGTLF